MYAIADQVCAEQCKGERGGWVDEAQEQVGLVALAWTISYPLSMPPI